MVLNVLKIFNRKGFCVFGKQLGNSRILQLESPCELWCSQFHQPNNNNKNVISHAHITVLFIISSSLQP